MKASNVSMPSVLGHFISITSVSSMRPKDTAGGRGRARLAFSVPQTAGSGKDQVGLKVEEG